MLQKAGRQSIVSSDEKSILAADKLILPGIGAFDTCAEKLKQSGLLNAINKKVVDEKTPVLGICVGMQLLMEGSEEGVLPGLGWIKGRVVKFIRDLLPAGIKIPHMGWSEIIAAKSSRI